MSECLYQFHVFTGLFLSEIIREPGLSGDVTAENGGVQDETKVSSWPQEEWVSLCLTIGLAILHRK